MTTNSNRQWLKVWGLIILWVVSLCFILSISWFLLQLSPTNASVGGYSFTIDFELISVLAFFTWLWLPFAAIGIGFIIFPHKVIDNLLQMREKIKRIFQAEIPEDDSDPHGPSRVFIVRSWGIMFTLIMGIPIIIILLTWQN